MLSMVHHGDSLDSLSQELGSSSCLNALLHRYSFQRINNRQLLKTLWEKKKLLITSNFFFSHNVFYSIRKLHHHLSIYMTSYLYLLLSWKSQKLACDVKKGLKDFITKRSKICLTDKQKQYRPFISRWPYSSTRTGDPSLS